MYISIEDSLLPKPNDGLPLLYLEVLLVPMPAELRVAWLATVKCFYRFGIEQSVNGGIPREGTGQKACIGSLLRYRCQDKPLIG